MVRRVLIVLILALLTVSLAHAEPIVFPAPTGPYQVGSTYRLWVDESRTERRTEDPDDKRQLLVRIWYPAVVAEGAVPMPAMPFIEELLSIIEDDGSVVFDVLKQLPAIQSHTVLDALLAESDTPFPTLLFSHGLDTTPDAYMLRLQELASHGYVVVGIFHTSADVTVLPDGTIFRPRPTIVTDMVRDLAFVMDQLALISADDPLGFFTGRLATDRFGLIGSFYGGAAADNVCRTDPRCAAYVNMEGETSGIAAAIALPPAMYLAYQGGGLLEAYRAWDGPAYGLRFKTFGYLGFMDWTHWPHGGDPELMLLIGTTSPEEALESVSAYLVAFFDKYMKGIDSPLLDGPSPDFPDVEFESRNIE